MPLGEVRAALNSVASQALARSESRWRGLTSQMAVDQALICYISCYIEDVPSVRCELPLCCNSKAHRHRVGMRMCIHGIWHTCIIALQAAHIYMNSSICMIFQKLIFTLKIIFTMCMHIVRDENHMQLR